MHRLTLVLTLVFSALYSVAGYTATIIITDLEDVDLGDHPPTAERLAHRVRACVNSRPPGPYRLIAQGLTSDGSFHLSNGADETLDYRVRASNRRNQLGRDLQPGVSPRRFFARPPNRRGQCRPPFLWITILVRPEALEQAVAGNYSGTLQLTVSPE